MLRNFLILLFVSLSISFTLKAEWIPLDNNRNADDNRDGRISIYELGSFSRRTTIKYSGETGHSQTPVINNFGKDVTVYILR